MSGRPVAAVITQDRRRRRVTAEELARIRTDPAIAWVVDHLARGEIRHGGVVAKTRLSPAKVLALEALMVARAPSAAHTLLRTESDHADKGLEKLAHALEPGTPARHRAVHSLGTRYDKLWTFDPPPGFSCTIILPLTDEEADPIEEPTLVSEARGPALEVTCVTRRVEVAPTRRLVVATIAVENTGSAPLWVNDFELRANERVLASLAANPVDEAIPYALEVDGLLEVPIRVPAGECREGKVAFGALLPQGLEEATVVAIASSSPSAA